MNFISVNGLNITNSEINAKNWCVIVTGESSNIKIDNNIITSQGASNADGIKIAPAGKDIIHDIYSTTIF